MKLASVLMILGAVSALCRADVTPPREGDILARQFGVRITLVDSAPRVRELPAPKSQLLPDYPREMRLALLQAAVNVRVEVAHDGRVARVAVTRNTERGANAKRFADAVESAVRKWSYAAAVGYDEKATAVTLDYEVVFALD